MNRKGTFMKTHAPIFALVLILLSLPVFSKTNDQIFQQKVELFIERIMSAYEIPGVAIGVVKDGKVYYTKGFGVKNIDKPEAVTASTLFHMASVSKPFVATALMQLAESGKVDLDQPVVRYLPYFKLDDPRCREITLRQMLTHTSGMPDVMDYEWGKKSDPEGALTRYTLSVKNEKLLFAPGEKWAYSNMAFEVLGNVIEKVSGLSFADYMTKNILTPLQMNQSSFLIVDKYRPLYAAPHVRRLAMEVSEIYPYNPEHAPSSTLHSSVNDMCRWALANLRRGQLDNRRILPALSYNQLWKVYQAAYDDYKIGLSWFLSEKDGELIVSHGGGDLGFATHFSMKPRQMAAVVVLTNHDYSPVQAISDGIWALLEDKEAELPKTPILIMLSKRLINGDAQTALATYDDLKRNHPDQYNFGEAQLNILGYQLLAAGRTAEAIEIFKLNVSAFPESANPYDSLGEAYMKAGQTDLAIENYQKSILLNPDNENGKQMLEKLRESK
jgi:CubicO group peptidase (beta-lactamase class C family)